MGDVEAVALVELDSCNDGSNLILPFGEPFCVAAVEDNCARSAGEHTAVAALDGPSPRWSPRSSPFSPPVVGLPTYDVIAAASAVWKPGFEVITLAIVSVSMIGAAVLVPPPLNSAALCSTCTGW